MAAQVFPTKGNLIASKKSLQLSTMGYDLMDRKRNILIREMMQLMGQSKMLRDQIEATYERAYLALQRANMTLGVVDEHAEAVPPDDGIKIRFRSVMGVDIPIVDYTEPDEEKLSYGLFHTNSELDNAYICFIQAKKITVVLAEVENSVYKLAHAIVKTQKRANALKNVTIPRLEESVKFITDSLEEKDREEFSRLKVIKAGNVRRNAGRGAAGGQRPQECRAGRGETGKPVNLESTGRQRRQAIRTGRGETGKPVNPESTEHGG